MATRATPEEIQRKAQARSEKDDLRRREAEKSLAEHRAKASATVAKTARLRALRLAKEAQDAADALANAASKAPAGKKSAKAKAKAAAK